MSSGTLLLRLTIIESLEPGTRGHYWTGPQFITSIVFTGSNSSYYLLAKATDNGQKACTHSLYALIPWNVKTAKSIWYTHNIKMRFHEEEKERRKKYVNIERSLHWMKYSDFYASYILKSLKMFYIRT